MISPDKVKVKFPMVDEAGRTTNDSEEMDVDRDEFVAELSKICRVRTENPFRLMLQWFGGGQGRAYICPISVVEEEHTKIVILADRCETYHSLPSEGALSDQDNVLMQAFDVFRKTRAEYEAERLDEMRRGNGS